MSNCVWVTNPLGDSELVFPLATNVSTDQPQRAIEAEKLFKGGGSVPADMCPTTIFYSEPRKPRASGMPHLFNAGGLLIVSARVAKVMQQYDLGGGALAATRAAFARAV